jgi:hypothetical protein
MMGGGVCLTRHDSWLSTRQQFLMLHATWQLYSAAMHSGVQFICPSMHGGGAKRPSFKNIFEPGSNKKNPAGRLGAGRTTPAKSCDHAKVREREGRGSTRGFLTSTRELGDRFSLTDSPWSWRSTAALRSSMAVEAMAARHGDGS